MARYYRNRRRQRPRVNRRPQACHFCGATVPANGGRMWKFKGRWYVAHLDCESKREGRVVEFYFPTTGARMSQNVAGRCEDAPCCGCCTF